MALHKLGFLPVGALDVGPGDLWLVLGLNSLLVPVYVIFIQELAQVGLIVCVSVSVHSLSSMVLAFFTLLGSSLSLAS